MVNTVNVVELCIIGIGAVFTVLLVLTVVIKVMIKLTDLVDKKRREKKLFLKLKNEVFTAIVGALILHTENVLSSQKPLIDRHPPQLLWKFADRLKNTRIGWKETAKVEASLGEV